MLEPEFCLMSRRPGIGRKWYERYRSDLDKGFITQRGVKMMAPKYYEKLLEKEDPFLHEHLKQTRVAAALDHAADNTDERLADREYYKQRILAKSLKRKI